MLTSCYQLLGFLRHSLKYMNQKKKKDNSYYNLHTDLQISFFEEKRKDHQFASIRVECPSCGAIGQLKVKRDNKPFGAFHFGQGVCGSSSCQKELLVTFNERTNECVSVIEMVDFE